MRYDVILWDVDGTLLDFSYSQRLSISKCLEEIGVVPTEEMIESYSDINESWWKRLERCEVTKTELLTGRFLDLFARYGIVCADAGTFKNHYETYLGEIFRYQDNSIEICRALQGRVRQFVVTNGVTVPQLSKLKRAGFFEIMEDIFISEQLGAPKPQKAFFDRVFESISDVERDRVLIVGDSLSSDIRGGNNAGIDTCWYNPKGESNSLGVITDYVIYDLKEVIKIAEG